LGEENVAAERKPSDAVFDAVFGAVGPNGRTETDGEALDEHPSSPGGKEVSEIEPPKKMTTRKIDQMLEKTAERSSILGF
jgi:hypothetical protein